jgi:hypothetical protein
MTELSPITPPDDLAQPWLSDNYTVREIRAAGAMAVSPSEAEQAFATPWRHYPMINSDKYFTIVFKDLTQDERLNLSNDYQDRLSASSYSHVMDDRDQLLDALSYAECALGDIGDADREPGDDLEWCEGRAAEALPRIRKLLLAHGRKTTSLSSAFIH